MTTCNTIDEVRFLRMIPAQVVRRRDRCPVAYLPVGALEWHGSHLPLGTDVLTVEHLAVRAAQRCGGVVFPAMTYGDVRYRLHDSRPEWAETYRNEMKLDAKAAAMFVYGTDKPRGYCRGRGKEAFRLPLSDREQTENFIRQIALAMREIALYGFRGIVLLPGHGPVTSPCRAAVKAFGEHARQLRHLRPVPQAVIFAYIVEAEATEPALAKHWIHADKLESSLLQILEPQTIHPEMLPKDRRKIPNAYLGGNYLHPKSGYSPAYRNLWPSFDSMDPREMNAAYGRKVLNFSVRKLSELVRTMRKELR